MVALAAGVGALVSATVIFTPPALATPSAPGAAAPVTGGLQTYRLPGALQVVLRQLEPRTVTPGAVVVASGTLINRSDRPYYNLSVRLQRGTLLTTRSALAADLAAPDEDTIASTPFTPVTGELPPGGSQPFRLSTPAAGLQLSDDGVYPTLINVNGASTDGVTRRVGEVNTYLVAQPERPVARTSVAWLWPLTDRPRLDAEGNFTDDDLAKEVAAGGRLETALAAVEKLPRATGSSTPTVPVTLAVDPLLVQELDLMAAGSYRVHVAGGATTAGTGSVEAKAYISRLRAVAANQSLVALPYADADLDALQSAGGSAAVRRVLPQSVPRKQPTDDSTEGVGARILRTVIGAAPRTDLIWPVDGKVQADTLRTLQEAGIDQLVLSEASYSAPAAAVADFGNQARPRIDVQTPIGRFATLVADTALSTAAGHLD